AAGLWMMKNRHSHRALQFIGVTGCLLIYLLLLAAGAYHLGFNLHGRYLLGFYMLWLMLAFWGYSFWQSSAAGSKWPVKPAEVVKVVKAWLVGYGPFVLSLAALTVHSASLLYGLQRYFG